MLTKLPISNITPFTLQDFPDRVACILWFLGCNFRCKYCHNPDLIAGTLKKLPFNEIESFLISRKGLLDGVVFSGGECTLSPILPELVRYVSQMGYQIKIDTNGSNPVMLEKLLEEGLPDYIAIDYKAPSYKHHGLTGSSLWNKFSASFKLLCNSNVQWEVRTTVHTDLLTEEDVNNIIEDLERSNFRGKYYIQNFKFGPTLGGLREQESILDITKLKTPEKFEIHYRNF